MTPQQRIEYINTRLKQLIEESKLASETKKQFMRIGYKLFLEEKKKLEQKLKAVPDQLSIK